MDQPLCKAIFYFLIYKTVYILTMWPSNRTSRCLPKWIENWCSHRKANRNDYCGFVHNCQKLKQSKCSSTAEWINKLVHPHNKKKWTADACNSIGEFQIYYVEWKMPDTKLHTLKFHFHDTLKKQNYRDRTTDQISGCQGLGVGKEVDYKWAWESFLGGDGMVSYLDFSCGYMTMYICQKS